MIQVECPGLPADWINSWLAAVGATVLDNRIQLHWTNEAVPAAVLSANSVNPVDALLESWPDAALLDDLPLAETWRETAAVERHVPLDTFKERARAARGHPNSWTLSSTITDLCVYKKGKAGCVGHAPFDAGGPGSIKWLHHRLKKVHKHVNQPQTQVRDALQGLPNLVEDNGLGFDQRRFGATADLNKKSVDPVVEVLAFFGLALLPVRGNGGDRTLDPFANINVRQRGWRRHKGQCAFVWPAWEQSLDRSAIDALLDAWESASGGLMDKRKSTKPLERTLRMLGVHAAWSTVRYEPKDGESTQAFGSRQLWPLNP